MASVALLGPPAGPLGGVPAAFTGRTVAPGSSWSARAAFDPYLTTVRGDGPLFVHRFDEGAGTTTAADSKRSGTLRPGTYGATTATAPSVAVTPGATTDGSRGSAFTASTDAPAQRRCTGRTPAGRPPDAWRA